MSITGEPVRAFMPKGAEHTWVHTERASGVTDRGFYFFDPGHQIRRAPGGARLFVMVT